MHLSLRSALCALLLAALGSGAYLADAENDDLSYLRADLKQNLAPESFYPQHAPLGVGQGIKPGAVVWTYDPQTVRWDGEGYWWELDNFDERRVAAQLRSGLTALTGAADVGEAWAKLFAYHKQSSGLIGGYVSGEKIAIKVNLNGAGEYGDDYEGLSHHSYVNPWVLQALLASLIADGGVNPADISVYDVTRLVPSYLRRLCSEGVLEGVNFVDRHNAQADLKAPLLFSYAQNETANYLPFCVTEADYLINLATLKGHNYGVTLTAKNHFGSFVNDYPLRAPQQAGLHPNLTHGRMSAYSVLTDLMGNYALGGKTVLYILEALICPSDNTIDITPQNSLWQSAPFKGGYTNSLLLSQDPVAIDSVGTDFLTNEPTCFEQNYALRHNHGTENYLHEAALADDPPSGAEYYDGAGQRLKSLGVHEHWNNPQDKQYSRNLGFAEGIELISVHFSQ